MKWIIQVSNLFWFWSFFIYFWKLMLAHSGKEISLWVLLLVIRQGKNLSKQVSWHLSQHFISSFVTTGLSTFVTTFYLFICYNRSLDFFTTFYLVICHSWSMDICYNVLSCHLSQQFYWLLSQYFILPFVTTGLLTFITTCLLTFFTFISPFVTCLLHFALTGFILCHTLVVWFVTRGHLSQQVNALFYNNSDAICGQN